VPATAWATYEAKDDQWEGIKKDPSAGCPDKNVYGRFDLDMNSHLEGLDLEAAPAASPDKP
jgi:hypothetical protein